MPLSVRNSFNLTAVYLLTVVYRFGIVLISQFGIFFNCERGNRIMYNNKGGLTIAGVVVAIIIAVVILAVIG